ncbi:MYCBP-associated protein isoform X2 [Strongylocentrotus purpuratus]|uniref:MYCBP-associated protein n=1 Tax=Strongylocentrotus purpuratus TaxID=7668 RepID=A0A7M7NZD2_STRPU|nr:MYCBP-associated protein isoform X2 [Strongylocentrotus purpuratus]|eukprot:XP_011681216.1 PREDICTED: MYCBP-associated protein isoform X2 [Strongylocentrotus purpuratus]
MDGMPPKAVRRNTLGSHNIAPRVKLAVNSNRRKTLIPGALTVQDQETLLNKQKRNRVFTPEKPSSPNNSQSQTEEEVIPPSKQVINGEDIQALAIDPQEFAKLRAPKPPQSPKVRPSSKPVTVRKMKPQSELDKPKTRPILIAKPAPPNAPLVKEDYIGAGGPRFDSTGNIMPHSILGTVEGFKMEAVYHGHMEMAEDHPIEPRPRTPAVKPEFSKKVEPKPRDPYMDENQALINWQQKMFERKKTQGYISNLLQKPPETLVMNQAEEYRQTQEERYIIDRAIPAMDYGKGYRVGSEFWKQQERFGDDLTGIHMTMSQTERGYPPPVEHIGYSKLTKSEMGIAWPEGRASPVHYPWKRSQYLKDRKRQLQHVIDELDPFKPDLEGLQVIGTNNPKQKKLEVWTRSTSDDVGTFKIGNGGDHDVNPNESEMPEETIPEPIIGPSLQFNGYPARWTGDSTSHKGQIACSSRVTFEAFAGVRTTSHLELVNDGTTTIYYDWKKIPKLNPFEGCSTPRIQRFYFNTSSGVLLPGESLRFPFVFKSPNAGIFTESWQLDTRPVVCGGGALQVTLRGVALQEDKNLKQRKDIEEELFAKQAQVAVRRILEELVDGIRTPERAHSPIDAYITDEETFERLNPGMHFANEVVSQLKQLHVEQFDEEEREDKEWDLDVSKMKREFLAIEDEEMREDLLNRMNQAVTSLYFPPFTPIQHEMYRVAYNLMMENVDNIVTQANTIRVNMGIPEKVEELPDTAEILAANDALRGGELKKRKKEPKEEETPGGKKDKKDGKKGKKDDKEKDRPKSKGGDKTPGKGKKSAPSPATPTKDREKKTPSGGERRGRARTPSSGSMEKVHVSVTGDPIMDAKYKNKLYIQVYALLSETVDKMTALFEDIKEKQDNALMQQLMQKM